MDEHTERALGQGTIMQGLLEGTETAIIEALRSKLRRIFDPLEEQTIRLCSLTPQQAAGNGSLADSGRSPAYGIGLKTLMQIEDEEKNAYRREKKWIFRNWRRSSREGDRFAGGKARTYRTTCSGRPSSWRPGPQTAAISRDGVSSSSRTGRSSKAWRMRCKPLRIESLPGRSRRHGRRRWSGPGRTPLTSGTPLSA